MIANEIPLMIKITDETGFTPAKSSMIVPSSAAKPAWLRKFYGRLLASTTEADGETNTDLEESGGIRVGADTRVTIVVQVLLNR